MSRERKESSTSNATMQAPRPGHGWNRPGMPVQKAKNFKGTLVRLISYFKPHTFRLSMVFLAAAASTIFNIISPKLMGNATTDLFEGITNRLKGLPGGGVDFTKIVHILIVLGGLYLFSALFSYIQQYMMAGIAQSVVYELRRRVNDKLTRLPIRFFDSRQTGEILSRFVNDFDNIGNTLQQALTQVITSVITFVGVVIMMCTISPVMTLVVFLTLPISFYVTKTIAKRSQQFFIGQQRSLGQLNAHVEEMYTGHTVVKAFGREEQSIQKFNESNERLYRFGWKAQFVSGMIWPLMNFISNISYVLVSVIGGILVLRKAITIGDIQAFIQYARQFSQPITQLSSISNIIQSTVASAERVFELLDEAEETPDVQGGTTAATGNGAVAFENVRFGYQEARPIIHDLVLDVKPGQMVAIVGPTGAGKTTIVNLLMRFYDIDAGHIRIDGIDIRDMRRPDLRGLFGMVLQDTWLFNGSIRDNIAYGREGATEMEIVAAAQAAHADHFIRTLPDGYDTILDEEASNISQGQKQLLTIARAILANPAILILDEATSSVDTRTEVHIQTAMNHLMEGRTSFVIAHRLSTIKGADLILAMNHGRVVEQGTHDELLVKGGFYADLYNSQFSLNGSA